MKEINYKCNLINSIKSKYILKKIFYNLIKIKTLYIIRYNKNIQKYLLIDINDYKECSQEIEIEIIPFTMSNRQKKKNLLIFTQMMKIGNIIIAILIIIVQK